MRRVDVEEAAAVGAELLDRDLRRRRARAAMICSVTRVAVGVLRRPASSVAVVVRAERLHDALRDEHEREDERERQQDVERAARQVDPEVADAVRRCLRAKPRISATSTAMPVAAETKFCTVEPEHLREVAHRRLAAVALPVRVRGEADGGVERRVGADRAEALRIQRQPLLQALQQVDDEQAGDVEDQHRDARSVFHVISSSASMPDEAIEQPLDRPADAVHAIRRRPRRRAPCTRRAA